MITSGVASPSVASNNIAVVITTAATNPATSPAEIAFVLVTMLPILSPQFVAHKRCSVRCLQRICCDAIGPEDSGCYSFAAARIFRARSTTMADVTCFIQA